MREEVALRVGVQAAVQADVPVEAPVRQLQLEGDAVRRSSRARRRLHVEVDRHKVRHMKAIQVVVDEELLERVDRSARRLKSSRSAAFRRLLALGLEQDALVALARAEARAYARTPESKDEAAAFRSLARSQRRVMRDLSGEEHW